MVRIDRGSLGKSPRKKEKRIIHCEHCGWTVSGSERIKVMISAWLACGKACRKKIWGIAAIFNYLKRENH